MVTLGCLFESGKVQNIQASSVSNFLWRFENSARKQVGSKFGQSWIGKRLDFGWSCIQSQTSVQPQTACSVL